MSPFSPLKALKSFVTGRKNCRGWNCTRPARRGYDYCSRTCGRAATGQAPVGQPLAPRRRQSRANSTPPSLCEQCRSKPRNGRHQYCSRTCAQAAARGLPPRPLPRRQRTQPREVPSRAVDSSDDSLPDWPEGVDGPSTEVMEHRQEAPAKALKKPKKKAKTVPQPTSTHIPEERVVQLSKYDEPFEED